TTAVFGVAGRRDRRRLLSAQFARQSGALHFTDRFDKLADVLEISVHGCKADVGDFVEFFQLGHDQFANEFGRDLALATGQQGFFDTSDHAVDLVGADRAFTQCQRQTAPQFGWVIVATTAIPLDHARHGQLDTLVGGETLVAGQTAATAANRIAFFGYPAVYYLGIDIATEWAFHD